MSRMNALMALAMVFIIGLWLAILFGRVSFWVPLSAPGPGVWVLQPMTLPPPDPQAMFQADGPLRIHVVYLPKPLASGECFVPENPGKTGDWTRVCVLPAKDGGQ